MAWLSRLDSVLRMLESLLLELTGRGPGPRDFERHRAFRWESGRGPGRLVPIADPAGFDLDDLVGVDLSRDRLLENTEQFLRGLPFNHVLLFGGRGTGKSSAVRGLLERHHPRGLRLVEIQRADLVHLPRVLDALRGDGSSHRFLLFCDDLSFGPGESGYRELKAALEGSLAAPPDNVCIVVTSNRRHLVPESMADNRAARMDEEGELHFGEASEEKLALSDRFGLALGFYDFDQPTYLAVVEHYLKQAGFDPSDAREAAITWAVRRASRSGRTARQFVDDWVGRHELAAQRGASEPSVGTGRSPRR